MSDYIHGYTQDEQDRLITQNNFLGQFIYKNIDLSVSNNIVELGCGVGAQMIKVLSDYPNVHVTGVDISSEQINAARKNLEAFGVSSDRYSLIHAPDHNLPIDANSFDTVLCVWVMEHVAELAKFVSEAFRILKSGGRFVSTEVFNDSLRVYPYKDNIYEYWEELDHMQNSNGGDGNVGIRVAGHLNEQGFKNIKTCPFPMIFDKTDPDARLSMWKYWFGLMGSTRDALLNGDFIDQSLWENVVLEFTELMSDDESVFYYSFIQHFATKN